MPFFTYYQTNSGGDYVYDAEMGLGEYVIIEAAHWAAANVRAERIGLYFDGEGDCSCCGDRWSEMWQDSGDVSPEIFGFPLEEFKLRHKNYSRRRYDAFVHYADGSITAHGFKPYVRTP